MAEFVAQGFGLQHFRAQAQPRDGRAQVVRDGCKETRALGHAIGNALLHGIEGLGRLAHLARAVQRQGRAFEVLAQSIGRAGHACQRAHGQAHGQQSHHHHHDDAQQIDAQHVVGQRPVGPDGVAGLALHGLHLQPLAVAQAQQHAHMGFGLMGGEQGFRAAVQLQRQQVERHGRAHAPRQHIGQQIAGHGVGRIGGSGGQVLHQAPRTGRIDQGQLVTLRAQRAHGGGPRLGRQGGQQQQRIGRARAQQAQRHLQQLAAPAFPPDGARQRLGRQHAGHQDQGHAPGQRLRPQAPQQRAGLHPSHHDACGTTSQVST